VKLIERDPRRARRISEILENTIVLSGDAADEELLVEENIDSADVFAALKLRVRYRARLLTRLLEFFFSFSVRADHSRSPLS